MKRDRPEEWQDAVDFDKSIRAADAALIASGMKFPAGRRIGLPYLHRSCVPLDEVVFDPDDQQAAKVYGMGNECAGVCGV